MIANLQPYDYKITIDADADLVEFAYFNQVEQELCYITCSGTSEGL